MFLCIVIQSRIIDLQPPMYSRLKKEKHLHCIIGVVIQVIYNSCLLMSALVFEQLKMLLIMHIYIPFIYTHIYAVVSLCLVVFSVCFFAGFCDFAFFRCRYYTGKKM